MAGLSLPTMQNDIRQRLKRALLTIAENPKLSSDERIKAATQLGVMLKANDRRSAARDREKLADLRAKRALAAQARIEKRRALREAAARAKGKPKPPAPVTAGPNSLGI